MTQSNRDATSLLEESMSVVQLAVAKTEDSRVRMASVPSSSRDTQIPQLVPGSDAQTTVTSVEGPRILPGQSKRFTESAVTGMVRAHVTGIFAATTVPSH